MDCENHLEAIQGTHLNRSNDALALDFVEFAISCGVLRFGEFITKAGRISPYFFNAGLFDSGAKLQKLATFYANRIIDSGLEFDMIFGPAYKGIPLAAAVAVELAHMGIDKPFSYNRKEAKDHGEGGLLVGAPLKGKVLIVDDVISAGTAIRESISLIQDAGATPFAVALALDRQEMATETTANGLQDLPYSAVQYVEQSLGLEVLAVSRLDDLFSYLQSPSERTDSSAFSQHLAAVSAYRTRYGT